MILFSVISLIENLIETVLGTGSLISTISSSSIISSLLLLIGENRPYPKTSQSFKNGYDYIIVGAGSAGSVLAGRLSENPCISVLLLEAGNVPPVLTDVPGYSTFFLQSDIDWKYETTPQKYAAFGQIDNKVILSSGKTTGGSSTLNYMLYGRGNRKDYDNWAAEGADGWSYEDVLPYFKKLEDNKNIDEMDSDFHSTGGPVTIEKPRYMSKIQDPVRNGLSALGFNITDSNGRQQTGIYDLQATLRNGRRCSAAKAYLIPAEDRPNLDILVNAFARKIMIKDKRAYGIEFNYDSKTHYVEAKREVVISSGSVRTSQILMLSGIGPKEHLEKFNIPVVADLPVGQNLQDHYGVLMNYLVKPTILPFYVNVLNPVNIAKFFATGKGPLASPGQVSTILFANGLDAEDNSKDFPKQEIYFIEVTVATPFLNVLNMKPEVYDQVYSPHYLKSMFVCFTILLRPKSRGEITLNSTDPYVQPNINPNYYQEDSDLQDVVEGMKICQTVAKSKQMEEIQPKLFSTPIPGCEQFHGDDDKYNPCFAKSLVSTSFHPVGTARMGRKDDPRSVVDPELRVIGVEGIRVVNGAVIPSMPSGNVNVPVMMIAEKAYDMMKKNISCDN